MNYTKQGKLGHWSWMHIRMEWKESMSTSRTRKDTTEKIKAATPQEKNVPEEMRDSGLLERSKYSLDLINTWITSADSKISTSCGIVSVVVAVLVFVVENILSKIDTANGAIEPWKTLFIVAALIAVIMFLISLFCHLRALSPSFFSGKDKSKQSKKEKCCIFYEDIKDYKNADEYIRAVRKMSEDQFVDNILQEAYCNSDICSKKMHEFKKGLWTAFASIVMIIVCAVCYFQMYHH